MEQGKGKKRKEVSKFLELLASDDWLRRFLETGPTTPCLDDHRKDKQHHHGAVDAIAARRARAQWLMAGALAAACNCCGAAGGGMHKGGARYGARRRLAGHRDGEVGEAQGRHRAVAGVNKLRRRGSHAGVRLDGPRHRLGCGQGLAVSACDGERHKCHLRGRAMDGVSSVSC